jgi:Flp pilus assembly protein TadG
MSSSNPNKWNFANSRRAQRGVILVLLGVMMAVLVGFMGLAIDVGLMFWVRRRAQTAADAAAMTAVLEMKRGSTFQNASNAAVIDSGLNGFTNGQSNTTVTINRPPLSGPMAGDNQAVEAIVSRTVPAYFMRIMGRNSMVIRARAVGRLGAGNACVYALNPTASSAFFITGTVNVSFACGVQVASNHSARAFNMNGGARLAMTNNDRVQVVGGWDISGQSQVTGSTGQNLSPINTSSVTDPFAHYGPPSTAGLNTISANGRRTYDMNAQPPGRAIPPGIYCGGLKILNTGGQTFTMNGMYIMAGGGLSIMSQARVTGTNTTIFNSQSSFYPQCTGNHPYDPIDFEGQAVVRITAPTSGPNEAMGIVQDRRVTGQLNRDNKLVGGSNLTIDGVLYFPTTPLLFSGNNSANGYQFIVADKISINGSSTVGVNYSSLSSGSPIKSSPVLTE